MRWVTILVMFPLLWIGASEEIERCDRQGLDLLGDQKYAEALEHFEKGLALSAASSHVDDVLVARGLVGSLVAHAYLGHEEEVHRAIEQLTYFISEYRFHQCPECQSADIMDAGVDFLNPNEQISVEDCKDRVWGTVNKMQAMVLNSRLSAVSKRELYFYLDQLEFVGKRCCNEGEFWTKCLTPVVEKWHEWKEQGVPLGSFEKELGYDPRNQPRSTKKQRRR